MNVMVAAFHYMETYVFLLTTRFRRRKPKCIAAPLGNWPLLIWSVTPQTYCTRCPSPATTWPSGAPRSILSMPMCGVRERRLGWPGQRRGRANRVRSQRSSAELPLLRHSGGSPASSCRHGVPTATVAAGLRCRRGIPGPPKVGGLRATWLRLAKHLCSWLGCTPRSSRRVWQGSTKTEVP